MTKRQIKINERQAKLLENALVRGRWWATGIILAPFGDADYSEAAFSATKRDDKDLQDRGLLSDCAIGGRRVTNAGALALKAHKETK